VRNFAKTKRRRHDSGYGLVFAAFGLVVLLGAAGMSVDIGYLRYQRRLVQSAADSAALAGAAVLGAGGGVGQAVTAAQNDSQINGFQDGNGNITVAATQTAVNGNNNTMQVVVTNVYPTFFMRIFGASMRNVTVSTTAIAQYLGGRGCIYALTGGTGINLSGAGSIDTPNCNVISNQSITGRGAITAAAVGAHNRSIGTTPPAVTGTLQVTDPLSYLAAPGTGGGCTNVDFTGAMNGNGPQTLFPGTYCQIVFEPAVPPTRRAAGVPAFNQPVTFRPGTYVITGGGGHNNGLEFEGTGTVTGNGVTFYIQNGPVNITNAQPIHLKASTNAPYAGILMFQAASNAAAATITGAGGSYMQGALYFPNATLNLDGASSNAATPGNINYMILVAKSLNIATPVNFPSTYLGLPNGYSPVRTTALIQ
jgi:Flp pilus assembly protein TadG